MDCNKLQSKYGPGSVFLPVSASYAVTASYAEYAVSASHEIIKEVSSSYADYAKESGLSTSSISASYALTASYALNSPDTFPYTGSAVISGSLEVTGSISVTGNITTNTISTISTLLTSDSATNVDTFATATYTGAIYDYTLVDTTVGARAGQFMVAQDNGNITFTDTSTKHLTDSPIPEITAQINGSNAEVQVTNGNGYTFKSFVKRL